MLMQINHAKLAMESQAGTNGIQTGCVLFHYSATLFRLLPGSLEFAARWKAFQRTFTMQLPVRTKDVSISMLVTVSHASRCDKCSL